MNKYLSFSAKITKIGSVHSEIIRLRAIITKKRRKKKEIVMQAKYITQSVSFLSGLNKISHQLVK